MVSKIEKKIRSFVTAHSALETLAWFLGAAGCIALLVWFLLFSGYGAPTEFIYDQF